MFPFSLIPCYRCLNRLSVALLPVLLAGSCRTSPDTVLRPHLEKYYRQYHVNGSFSLYNPQENRYILYNPDQFEKGFTPASTFKICNSLIGLETGVIGDADYVLPWDSVLRPVTGWNQDQDLRSAFKNSTVWYYQELARRVGGKLMKQWLDSAQYGNADTSGGIDRFWLDGGLRISPAQQLDFLQRLHDGNLPFSGRSMDIVKDIMFAKDTLGFVIRAKTGWGFEEGKDIGWYVGWMEKQNKVFYFANCIQTSDSANKDFRQARTEIFYRILSEGGF